MKLGSRLRGGRGMVGAAVVTIVLATTIGGCTPDQVVDHLSTAPDVGVSFRTDIVAPNGVQVLVAYPTNLPETTTNYPLVTYGNGTGNPCHPSLGAPDTNNRTSWDVIEHLVKWGYVVACAMDPNVGSGVPVWTAAQVLFILDAVQTEAGAPNPMYNRLDTDDIAAVGHSQGAAGAANATMMSGGLIKTTVSIAQPDWTRPEFASMSVDFSKHTAPLFLLAGDLDGLSDLQDQKLWCSTAPGLAYMARRAGADHVPVAKMSLGAITAWLQWQLGRDPGAAVVFGSQPPTGYLQMHRKPAGPGPCKDAAGNP